MNISNNMLSGILGVLLPISVYTLGVAVNSGNINLGIEQLKKEKLELITNFYYYQTIPVSERDGIISGNYSIKDVERSVSSIDSSINNLENERSKDWCSWFK